MSSQSNIRNHKVVRLDSVLYNQLWEAGSYALIAVYCELKAFRNKPERYVPIKHSNNKSSSGYSLLKTCTGISINTLQKNVPILVEMGLCHFDQKGGFVMLGNNKTRFSKTGKLVPIRVGSKFTDTRLSAKFVMVASNLRRQEILWKKKETLSELMKVKASHSRPLSKSEHNMLRAAYKRGELSNLKTVKTSILSNKRMSELVSGGLGRSNLAKKSSGKYIKNRFKSKGWLSQKRRFRDLFGRYVPFHQYKNWKHTAKITGTRISWRKGRVVTELTSEVNNLSDLLRNFFSFEIQNENLSDLTLVQENFI